MIQCVIDAVGLDDCMNHGKYKPAESSLLVKYNNGKSASGTFSYRSVVGMLLYFSGHTRPDVAHTMNCCYRYMFCTKHLHQIELIRLGWYLNQIQDHGLVLNPNSNACKLDAYPDAYFAGCLDMKILLIMHL